MDAAPDLVEDRLLGDRLARPPGEAEREIHRPRLERHRFVPTLEPAEPWVDSPGAELELAVEGVRARVGHAPKLATKGREP